MRYIANEQIKPGMILANTVYGPNFEVMLGKGVSLSASYIKRINNLGYSGVYIKDEISEGIEPEDVIDPAIRLQVIKYSKELLLQAEHGGNVDKVTRESQRKTMQPLIEAILESETKMAELIDLKPFDDYMYYHTANAVILSLLVGAEMDLSETALYELGMAALLHDVGNIFIPKTILNKPGSLTKEEFEIVKSHSKMGFNYLYDHFDLSIGACMGALQHHENYDGSGYPDGLKKDEISIYGRIIAITDVYDALVSRRPFRQAVFPSAALDFMEARAGIMFDPLILESLKHVVAFYPTGCAVELDTEACEKCIVEKNFYGDSARPRLRLLNDPSKIIDLHTDRRYSRVNILQIIDI